MNTALLASVSFALVVAAPKTVVNPLGFKYELPAGWSVAGSKDAYQVIRRPGQTENELFIIGGAIEFDAKTSWDKKLQNDDVAMMSALGPWTQEGGATSFDAKGGKGMLLRFTGINEGVEFQGDVWSLLADKKRFGILAVYPKELSPKLYGDFYAIAKSLRPDETRKISTNNAHAKVWSQKLAGYKLKLSSANNSGSGNGSAGDAVDKTFVFLPDGTFQYYMRSMSFVSAGEFSGTSESNDQAVGRWSIQSDGKNAFLILKPVGKPTETFPLSTRGSYIVMNGKVFSRTKI